MMYRNLDAYSRSTVSVRATPTTPGEPTTTRWPLLLLKFVFEVGLGWSAEIVADDGFISRIDRPRRATDGGGARISRLSQRFGVLSMDGRRQTPRAMPNTA
jgi:hypothetical protein